MIEGSDSRRDRMKTKPAVLCACAVFMVFLIVGCAPKSKAILRSGPQSMLYLKGRYGRRYASDNDGQYYKPNPEDFSAFLKS
ncbi:LOW QUALITY PROTEIN: spexin prohormone 2-like [Ciconia maguari]